MPPHSRPSLISVLVCKMFYLLLQLYMFLSVTAGTSQNYSQNGSSVEPVLRFGVFISQNSTNSFEYAGFIPSLEIGFETVNNCSSVLTREDGEKYRITYDIRDAKCEAASSLLSFIDLINGSQPIIMLLGSDCSVSTEPVASISHHWNLVQISQASSSPYLSNTNAFPKFLRTISSDAEVARGILRVLEQFGWSRVVLLTQSETIFTSFSTEFQNHIRYSNSSIRLLGEYIFTTNSSISLAVESLQRSSGRIIFLNMYEESAARVMCLAYKRNLRYPNYVWIIHNWYNLEWWRRDSSDCTSSQLREMLSMQLTIDHFPRINEEEKNRMNIGGITWNEYEESYNQIFDDEGYHEREVSYNLEDGAFMFDTVWAAALALNETAKRGYSLADFNYTDENISSVIYDEILKVEFFGLTGEVYFDNTTGDRIGRIRYLQYRDDGTDISKQQFGSISSDVFVFVNGSNIDTVFPSGVPADQEYVRISLPLFITYSVLAVLGVVFSCVCLWFNLWFRDHKIVKLSSPYVNVMIIAGAIVFYLTVILFGVDENVASFSFVDDLCQTRIWLCVIGFSLLFGTIFAKAWRIYYIFSHLKPNNKTEIKDLYLFAIVVVLLILDVIFMLPPTIISSSILKRKEREIISDDGDLPEIIGVCDSKDSLEWLIVLFIYKGLILLVGVFLAVEIRKVKIVSLNESRFIGMSVYGAVIVSIALTPIGFLLEESPTTQYAIIGIMVLASATIILILVFVSKMYKVYRDPEGKTVQINVTTTTDHQRQPQPQPRASFQYSEDVYRLQIQKLNGEISTLRQRLKENNLNCDFDHKLTDNHTINSNHGNGITDEVDDNHVIVIDRMNNEAEHSTKV